ncbi:MAG TPA: phage holin family protein [Candidatus Limnocylindria bacterium]|nr:phage holin family protein [Candidatus Limnocylindria bacterium]
MTHADEPRPSIFALARQLVGGVIKLAKLELAQGRQEIGEMLAETRTGVVMFAVAFAIVLIALVTLDIFFVLGLLALFEVLPPVASAIIIVAAFVAVLALYGAFGAFGRLPAVVTIGIVVLVALLAVGFAVPVYLGFSAAWLSALFVFVFQLLLAGVFVARGISHVRIGPPEQTIASVKEDIAWAKRLLKRG